MSLIELRPMHGARGGRLPKFPLYPRGTTSGHLDGFPETACNQVRDH
ncbi:MAG: hypothetical protein JOZ29_18610 [Deltaproteobacteria bacterium]|nr:hypothetical protein [Deltaproteobacteria bacterium]